MNKNKTLEINKGIVLPTSLLNNKKFNINTKLVIGILVHFKKAKTKQKEETLYTTWTDMCKIIPLSKRTIITIFDILQSCKYIRYESKRDSLIIHLDVFFHNYKKQGYIYIPKEILYNDDLSTSEKYILSYVRGYYYSDAELKMTNQEILNNLGISKKTLIYGMKKLKEEGLIEVKTNSKCPMKANRKILYVNKLENVEHIENVNNVKTIENVEHIEHIETQAINVSLLNTLQVLDKKSLLDLKKKLNEELNAMINNK